MLALNSFTPPADAEYRLISLDIELNFFEMNKTGQALEVDDEELQDIIK